MKKLVSAAVAALLLCTSAAPAFAGDDERHLLPDGSSIVMTVRKVGSVFASGMTLGVISHCTAGDTPLCTILSQQIVSSKSAMESVFEATIYAAGAVLSAGELRPAQSFISAFAEGGQARNNTDVVSINENDNFNENLNINDVTTCVDVLLC